MNTIKIVDSKTNQSYIYDWENIPNKTLLGNNVSIDFNFKFLSTIQDYGLPVKNKEQLKTVILYAFKNMGLEITEECLERSHHLYTKESRERFKVYINNEIKNTELTKFQEKKELENLNIKEVLISNSLNNANNNINYSAYFDRINLGIQQGYTLENIKNKLVEKVGLVLATEIMENYKIKTR